MRSRLRLLLVAILLAGACADDSDREGSAAAVAAALPGVYGGIFPCENCPGIRATLWLRSDGRFFIRQIYSGEEGREETTAYGLGRWRWSERDRVLLLEGDGPGRVFTRPEDGTLIMRTASDLEHRLSREPELPRFTASIRMTGMMSRSGDGVLFTECLTGLTAAVDEGGDFRRFRHQHRSIGRPGEPTYVELEGHFSWSDDGAPRAMTIDRFITVKEGRRDCRP